MRRLDAERLDRASGASCGDAICARCHTITPITCFPRVSRHSTARRAVCGECWTFLKVPLSLGRSWRKLDPAKLDELRSWLFAERVKQRAEYLRWKDEVLDA